MKKLMFAILVLMSVGFAMAQQDCESYRCDGKASTYCKEVYGCGPCADSGDIVGYCTTPIEPPVPEFSTIGIIALIVVAAMAGFFIIRKK
jgi:hypothetical protein